MFARATLRQYVRMMEEREFFAMALVDVNVVVVARIMCIAGCPVLSAARLFT